MDADLRTTGHVLPAWAEPLFTSALVPAMDAAGHATPVWAIAGDASEARISEQFKANAGDYHARYAASRHFEKMFRKALDQTGLAVAADPLIFDMGSGSGVNSIVPCFNLFPGARQVATDLSGDLLAMLAGYAAETGLSDRVVCVVMDAMSAHAEPGSFDLVTGSAILHHLAHPRQGLEAAAKALKPGGHAIFMEPFDGHGLLRLAYQRILAEAELRGDPLAPEAATVLRNMVVDITARTLPDPNAPMFAHLDDKWLFSREHLEAAGRKSGFSEVRFVPHNDHVTLYRDMAFVHLRLSSGLDSLTLPDWAIAILDEFDAALPGPVKRLLMLEGSIVFTKAA
jgi:SAM-dependent methyltransferase